MNDFEERSIENSTRKTTKHDYDAGNDLKHED